MKDTKKTIAATTEERWVSLPEIMEILKREHDLELTEATFRKYVQLDLLPRSRRIGQKGKHKGSSGIYPFAIVGRILLIKRLMQENLTLEEIRDKFLFFQNKIDSIKLDTAEFIEHFQTEMFKQKLSEAEREKLNSLLKAAGDDAVKLLNDLEALVKTLREEKGKKAPR